LGLLDAIKPLLDALKASNMCGATMQEEMPLKAKNHIGIQKVAKCQ
jgi:hypothetical protein